MAAKQQPSGQGKCGAERKENRGPCTRPAGWGTDHAGIGSCKFHGGSTPSHKRSAQKEIARQAVVRFGLLDEGETPAIDPREVLAEELWRTRKVVRGLDEQVADLAELYGPTFHATGYRTGEAKPSVVWVMWQEQRVHLKAVASEAARAGIEEFRAQLEQRQVDMVEQAFDAVMDELGLTATQRRDARRAYGRHLRLVEAR